MGFAESILHVDMDAFYVEVERLRRPELRGRPVAVGGRGGRGVIASASYEARELGVTSAMPTARALRLCPELQVVAADHAEYRSWSERVFEIFRDTTPLVEGLSLDEAFLDVSGLRLHADSPVTVAEGIRARIRDELALPASVGIAPTKFVAKLASERAKPDGILHVPADRQLEFLHPLPVRALWGVGEATHAALTGLGVETVGDLAAVDTRSLASAVGGSLAEHLSRLSRGIDPRRVEPDSEAKSMSVEHTYERDLATDDELTVALRGHADRVTSRARRAGVKGRTVTLKVRFGDFTTVTRSETLPEPTAVGITVYRVATDLLRRVERRGRGVRLLGLGLSGLVPDDAPRQLTAGSDDRWERLEGAVDTVRQRFGAGAVRPARIGDEPPDRDDR